MEPPRYGWRTRESLQTALTRIFAGARQKKGQSVFSRVLKTLRLNFVTFTGGERHGNQRIICNSSYKALLVLLTVLLYRPGF